MRIETRSGRACLSTAKAGRSLALANDRRIGPRSTLSDYAVVIQAALLSQGLALGWLTVVSHALKTSAGCQHFNPNQPSLRSPRLIAPSAPPRRCGDRGMDHHRASPRDPSHRRGPPEPRRSGSMPVTEGSQAKRWRRGYSL